MHHHKLAIVQNKSDLLFTLPIGVFALPPGRKTLMVIIRNAPIGQQIIGFRDRYGWRTHTKNNMKQVI
jgi:hypothetical protein